MTARLVHRSSQYYYYVVNINDLPFKGQLYKKKLKELNYAWFLIELYVKQALKLIL